MGQRAVGGDAEDAVAGAREAVALAVEQETRGAARDGGSRGGEVGLGRVDDDGDDLARRDRVADRLLEH